MYNNETKVKDLTVEELKSIILECLQVLSYNSSLECIGKFIKSSQSSTGRVIGKGESNEDS